MDMNMLGNLRIYFFSEEYIIVWLNLLKAHTNKVKWKNTNFNYFENNYISYVALYKILDCKKFIIPYEICMTGKLD